ncbi:MAG TPA: 5-formyltetrahydrofolate cyclo-ligase [Streptosporangiaceae bacterium]|jgi:5-formyltetrahydrofolate cyclo-ligase
MRTKAELRADLLAARRARTEDERTAAARALRDTVLGLHEAEMAGTVAVYLSFGAEPATTGLAYAMWKRGTYVLAPRMLPDRDLDWASYEGPDDLRHGAHGGPEPIDASRGVDAVRRADLVIVPALAVDGTGLRLGRGGGSYDRVLARLHPNTLTIALVYDDELVGELPAEPHDHRVRAVLTPGGGLRRFH